MPAENPRRRPSPRARLKPVMVPDVAARVQDRVGGACSLITRSDRL